MRPVPTRPSESRRRRRGVTLIEMLVVVGLLVLVMTILVSIFVSATGAITVSRTYAQLGQELRRANSLLRRDLEGATARNAPSRMTPPLNPEDANGYFTYGENALADLQGEDTDDYVALTVKAPDGQPFVGRVAVLTSVGATATSSVYNLVQVTSEYAEVIYFLRNGNLYRRVFLVLPERQTALTIGPGPNGGYPNPIGSFPAAPYGSPSSISWLAANDISARPASAASGTYVPVLNSLKDLTNRENRAFNPRFSNDYRMPGGMGPVLVPDGRPDDFNGLDLDGDTYPDGDGLPDLYPTLYPQVFNAKYLGGANPLLNFPTGAPSYPGALSSNAADVLAFPYIYPNAYSQTDFNPTMVNYGTVHSLDPTITPIPTAMRPNLGSAIDPAFNHNPLDLGDNLPYPTTPAQFQTWWGFPTKKETLSPYWTDPIKQINNPNSALPNPTDPPGRVPPGEHPLPAERLPVEHQHRPPAAR